MGKVKFFLGKFVVSFAFVFLFGIYGCGGNGSSTVSSNVTNSTTSGSTASISGSVVDGYVSGAAVYVYNSTDMRRANLIGNGTTDSNGDFSITLNVSSLPSIIYIKTVGGVDINTGLPAPTMLFVANSTGVSSYTVSPFTTKLYSYFVRLGDLSNATNTLVGKLGINATDIYGDPMQSDTLSNLLWQILAAQTGAGTIPDGNYTVTIIYVTCSDIDDSDETITNINDLLAKKKFYFNATVNNGVINGTMQSEVGPMTVTGKIVGSAMLMNITDNNVHIRIAGKIGQYGGVSGIYTEFDELDSDTGTPTLDKGVFIASFINTANMNSSTIDGMSNLVTRTFTGKKHFVYWDMFVDIFKDIRPRIGFGYSNVTSANITSGIVTAQNINMYRDAGSNVNTNPVAFNFMEGRFIKDGDMPLGIAIMRFRHNNRDIFIVSHIGNREGLYFKTYSSNGTIVSVGKCSFTPDNNFAPKLESGVRYHLHGVFGAPFMLDLHRKDALSRNTFDNDNVTPPSAAQQHPPYTVKNDRIVVFGGGTVVIKKDVDDDFSDGGIDFIKIMNMYDTGASGGMHLVGGSHVDPFEGNLVPNTKFPAVFVGYFNKVGEPIPSVNGTMNFLARAIYTNDPGIYVNAYVYGNLTISGDTAILRYESANSTSESNATLVVANDNGVYHIYGDVPGGDYMDLYWPVGGYTALYMISDSADDANGTITELGEAFITP